MVQDRATLKWADLSEVLYDLLNGAIFIDNDLE